MRCKFHSATILQCSSVYLYDDGDEVHAEYFLTLQIGEGLSDIHLFGLLVDVSVNLKIDTNISHQCTAF